MKWSHQNLLVDRCSEYHALDVILSERFSLVGAMSAVPFRSNAHHIDVYRDLQMTVEKLQSTCDSACRHKFVSPKEWRAIKIRAAIRCCVSSPLARRGSARPVGRAALQGQPWMVAQESLHCGVVFFNPTNSIRQARA
jgi:hypothetical protein